MMPGGMHAVQAATAEEAAFALKMKSAIEAKAGATFDKFELVSFATQVVAGTNHFMNIDTGAGHIHARVYQPVRTIVVF